MQGKRLDGFPRSPRLLRGQLGMQGNVPRDHQQQLEPKHHLVGVRRRRDARDRRRDLRVARQPAAQPLLERRHAGHAARAKHVAGVGELSVFCAAVVAAGLGFLWYNAYPAQVFMGDTGSLALGGIIATFAIAIRKELLIPVLCGIFLVENLSVVMQVSYFKYTKKKYGEGRRIFKMSPLHHHYQKLGYHESKIVSRFWIIGIMLAIVTIITLKLR